VVEVVFSAAKDRAASEQDLLEELFKVIELAAKLGGEALEAPLIAAAAAAFAPFAGIGMGYMAMAEDVKRRQAPGAFSEGVVMGQMAEGIDLISDHFWMHQPAPNNWFKYAGQVEQYYNNGGLVLGYAYGAELRGALGQVFWADLAQGGATPLGDPDQDNWGSREWRDFYISVAMIFMRNHIRGND